MEAPAEVIGRLGIGPRFGLRLQPIIGIERMLLALELLLIGELFPLGLESAHRLEVRGVRPDGFDRGRGKVRRRAGRRHARDEAFEISTLLRGEIAVHALRLSARAAGQKTKRSPNGQAHRKRWHASWRPCLLGSARHWTRWVRDRAHSPEAMHMACQPIHARDFNSLPAKPSPPSPLVPPKPAPICLHDRQR